MRQSPGPAAPSQRWRCDVHFGPAECLVLPGLMLPGPGASSGASLGLAAPALSPMDPPLPVRPLLALPAALAQERIAAFLSRHPQFEVEPPPPSAGVSPECLTEQGFLQVRMAGAGTGGQAGARAVLQMMACMKKAKVVQS